jgi:hypothetical protein
MGTATPTRDTNSWLLERYHFIDQLTVAHLGSVAVFKKKQENYDYIALITRNVRRDYLREIQRELCFLTGKNIALPFLKIFQVEVGQLDLHDSLLTPQHHHHSGRCWQEPTEEGLSIYMELLTYTLQEHLAYRREAKSEITLKEYSYILKTALAAAQLYEEWRLDYLELSLASDSIFLKPNGEVKLLPFRSRYIREPVGCGECVPQECEPKGEGHGEFHTYSFSSPKKKEGKYLKQLKNLSLELFTTINPNVDLYVRSIPNFNRSLLSLHELQALKDLQFAVVGAQSLREVYCVLGEVEDDLLRVQREESSVEVEVNNPEVYQAFV